MRVLIYLLYVDYFICMCVFGVNSASFCLLDNPVLINNKCVNCGCWCFGCSGVSVLIGCVLLSYCAIAHSVGLLTLLPSCRGSPSPSHSHRDQCFVFFLVICRSTVSGEWDTEAWPCHKRIRHVSWVSVPLFHRVWTTIQKQKHHQV